MAPDARKTMIQRLYDEVWNQGKLVVADELFGPDFVAPLPGAPPGPEGERQHVGMIRAAFPDLQITVEELVADGDTVAARWTLTGTNTGPFMDRPSTGRSVTFWGVHFFHFANDRISSCWIG